MKRPIYRALQGLLLSVGSPLGWLLLQWLGGSDPWLLLVGHPGVYLYMLVGTAIAFSGFGWYVGWQEERFRDSALHDALTGLYNPRYFWHRIGDEVAFSRRHGRPLSLLIGDLDFFKRVNDGHGHAVGDRVLAAVAGAMMSVRRRGDTLARVGGEEFAVILPETGLEEAVQVAERLREAVAALRFDEPPDHLPFSLTMSFGAVSSTPDSPLTADELYRAADAAMYYAKQAGRNRVEAAHGAMTPPVPGAAVARPTPSRPAQ